MAEGGRPLMEVLGGYYDRIAVWRGYEQQLETLGIYAVGIAVYAAFVFAFYQYISKRRAFMDGETKGWAGRFLRLVDTGLVFPVLSFVYFGFLTMALFLLSKDQSTGEILLTSMAVILSIRVTAYVNERISVDLAKLVPFGLLGVVVVQPGFLDLNVTWLHVREAVGMYPLLARYFLLFIVVEFTMRAFVNMRGVVSRWWDARQSKSRYAKPKRVAVEETVKTDIPSVRRQPK